MIKAIPTLRPINPATKDTIGRILLIIDTIRFKSVRVIIQAKRHRADNADRMQAIVTNARATIILLHTGRFSNVSCEHVSGKFSHNITPLTKSQLPHRPTVNFPHSAVTDPLKHI